MKKTLLMILAGFFFMVLPGVSIFPQNGLSVKDIIFLPKEFYVGDQVELRISIEEEPGQQLVLPEAYPDSVLLEIHDVTMSRDDGLVELRILFTPFAPGTRSLPAIDLGGAVLDKVKVYTSSLLDGENVKFQGIRKPLLVPGTKLLLGIFIGFLFIGPVFVLSFAGTIRRKFHLIIALRRGRRPGRKLLKVLRELAESKDGLSSRQFYFTLSDEYRKYLLQRTDIDFLTSTSTDFGKNLGKIIKDKAFVQSASEMILFSDSIKFGGVTVDSSRKDHDLDIVRKSMELIEKSVEEKARRKGPR